MDTYTPYGYLDNTWHCARLNPGGVVRCRPAVGFSWYFPGRGGPYVRRQLYSAGLRLVVHSHERPLLTPLDFEQAGISIVSRIHSKNIISFDWQLEGLAYSAALFLGGEHALCCLMNLHNISHEPLTATVSFVAEYEREIGASEAWDCGLIGCPIDGGVSLVAYAEGEAFVCLADDSPSSSVLANSLESLLAALGAPAEPLSHIITPPSKGSAFVGGAIRFDARLSTGEQTQRLIVLSRGVNQDVAVANAREAMSSARGRYRQLSAADEHFRQQSPSLAGHWPDHWRRGFVYDLQSVRAMVRPPIGIYGHPWDAMQAQSPRSVLAEAALDALILSYASPELAKQVMLGVFADAKAPNVPCSREDGSFNMVADDGTACGTAPEWCFPIHCIDILSRRAGDRIWQLRIYPHLSRYLNWWLRQRSDKEGWLHYGCSWESGQDESPRFGPQLSGGSSIQHIRPVDLHASIAHAASILARWSGDLDRPGAARRWQRLAEKYRLKTAALWHDSWFHDFDCRAGAFVPFRDAMHLAPLLAGAADPAQLVALRSAFDALPVHGVFDALEWPPVVFTVVESASAAGWLDVAARIARRVADRVYLAYDSRSPSATDPLPGIASERWATEGSWGCESYGWGALSILLVLRHVVGWHEGADGGVYLCPQLPPEWLAAGRDFAVDGLRHQGVYLDLVYRCLDSDRLEVSIELRGEQREALVLDAAGQRVVFGSGKLTWHARNGQRFQLRLPFS